MRSWRPLDKLLPSFKDTNTSPLGASSESVPGFPDFPSVTLLMNSSDSSTTTLRRPTLRLLIRTE